MIDNNIDINSRKKEIFKAFLCYSSLHLSFVYGIIDLTGNKKRAEVTASAPPIKTKLTFA